MTIAEAIIKNKIKVGDIVIAKQNKKFRVRKIDYDRNDLLCSYANKQEQEEMIKRGYTVVRLKCYDDYRPVSVKG